MEGLLQRQVGRRTMNLRVDAVNDMGWLAGGAAPLSRRGCARAEGGGVKTYIASIGTYCMPCKEFRNEMPLTHPRLGKIASLSAIAKLLMEFRKMACY